MVKLQSYQQILATTFATICLILRLDVLFFSQPEANYDSAPLCSVHKFPKNEIGTKHFYFYCLPSNEWKTERHICPLCGVAIVKNRTLCKICNLCVERFLFPIQEQPATLQHC